MLGGSANETIGTWTRSELIKFIGEILRQEDKQSRTFDELTIHSTLKLSDQLQFFQSVTSVGAAGGASALPATPTGYIKILDPTGQVRVIPYFNS